MTVLGIDLGTTYSCAAYMDDVGRPAVVRNSDGVDTTPSVVYFESSDNVVVGQTAKEEAKLKPDLVVSLIKREIGQDFQTDEMHGKRYTPEEVSARILRKLADDAGASTSQDVVITVPAYFGLVERNATKEAGRIAGLHVIDIISEPIAAAIDYGVIKPEHDQTILVYDLGGGTFDTTVITVAGGNITVECTDGDHRLGGADWDRRLVEYLAQQFIEQYPDAGDPLEDSESEQELLTTAEDAKRHLSAANQRTARVTHNGRTANVEITRERLEELTRDLVDQTVDITRRILDTAEAKSITSFDEVVLVGGATRMPAVQTRLVEEFSSTFRNEPKLHDPDLAVAKGAARYAYEESYRRLLAAGDEAAAEEMADKAGLAADQQRAIAGRTISTVASRSFGIKVKNDRHDKVGYVDHPIHANDRLPASPTQEYCTLEDGQTHVLVEVMEQAGASESQDVAHNTVIASGDIAIPPGKPAGWPIDVTFELDTSGLLHVTAVEKETGERLELEVQVGGMTEDEVASASRAIAATTVS